VFGQALGVAWPDTPDVLDGADSQRLITDLPIREVEHAIASFGQPVGELGQCLGGADADAVGDSRPAMDALAQFVGESLLVRDSGQVQEAFVDGIYLHPRDRSGLIAVPGGQHDVPILWLDGAVDDEDVSITMPAIIIDQPSAR